MLETGQSGQARKRSRACVGNAPGRCMTAQGGRDHVRACTCARYLGLGNAGNGWPNPVNTLSLSTFQSWARAPWPSRNRKQQWHLTALPGHMQVASWIHANGRLRQPRQPASSTWQSGKHLGAGSTRSQEIAKVPGFSDSPHGTRSLMCPHIQARCIPETTWNILRDIPGTPIWRLCEQAIHMRPGRFPGLAKGLLPGKTFGQAVDPDRMVFFAVLPVPLLAFVRRAYRGSGGRLGLRRDRLALPLDGVDGHPGFLRLDGHLADHPARRGGTWPFFIADFVFQVLPSSPPWSCW